MADAVYGFLKVTVVIAISAVFLVAINNLIGFVGSLIGGGIVGEIFSLISMYLPFNAGVVFGSIFTACGIILSFKVAKKIWDMVSWSISAI